MITNNVSLTILINGTRTHSAREYISPMDRQTYIEGRQGSNFTIQLRNENPFRVLAIPSVDGLSVLDGKPAGANSPGYILNARQTLDIPGWVVDSATAAKFFFAGMKADGSDESYVGEIDADTANKGLIGLMVFRETPTYMTRGIAPVMRSRRIMSGDAQSKGLGIAPSASTDTLLGSAGTSFESSLGTGFGEATNFKTTKASFDKGDLISKMVIRYDDARGLRKHGIDVSVTASPGSAFPADETSCTPPAGWVR